jgi:hypothetical protein
MIVKLSRMASVPLLVCCGCDTKIGNKKIQKISLDS